MDQLIIPQFIFFFILITWLLPVILFIFIVRENWALVSQWNYKGLTGNILSA